MKIGLIITVLSVLLTGVILNFLFGGYDTTPKSVFVKASFVKNNEVVLNDTVKLTTNSLEEYTRVKIPGGENTVSVNGKELGSFIVEKSNGILNVAKEDFYIYPIKYIESNSVAHQYNIPDMNFELPVVFDSYVVYSKYMAKDQDGLVKKDLNGSRMRRYFRETRCRKISKEEMYVEKSWEYNLIEDVPESTLSEERYVKKDKVINSKQFILLSSLSDQHRVEKLENQELAEMIDQCCEKYSR